jgi:thioredoxin-dependent peroxiredoxin
VEGQGFRDRTPEFEEANAVLLGVSFDPPEKNLAFAEGQGFPYRLLSDLDKSVGEAYETKRAPGEADPTRPKRRTYLIDPHGVIRRAYRVRDVTTHPDEVLQDLRRHQAGVAPGDDGG